MIVAAILGGIAVMVLCEVCYTLGKIEGRKTGFIEAYEYIINKAKEEVNFEEEI